MATSPALISLLQRLGGRGAPGGPPGAPPGAPPGGAPGGMPPGLLGARQGAMTPRGDELQDLKELKSRVGTLSQRVLDRSSEAAQHFLKAYQELERGEEVLQQLPAQPVAAPPPGFPGAGGPMMTPPMAEAGPGMFG